jgi:hypothetical protein
MKTISLKLTTLLLLLLSFGFANAQEYEKVDAIAKTYSKSYNDIDKLAAQIKNDFKREDERARALFTWIALNIRYDNSPAAMGRKPLRYSYRTEAERRAKIAAIENDLAQKTLATKKGVCHGYAMLYTIVARKMGMESEVVHGSAKALPSDIGKMPGNSNHAWNAIKVNGQWKLVDVTWGAGGISAGAGTFAFRFDDKYFFTNPNVFFLNHFPDDKQWLLTGKNESEFAALPLYYDLGYEMLSPGNGVIKKPTAGTIPFRIKGIKPSDEVVYQFTSGAFSSRVTPKIANGIGEFNVPLDKSAKGTLTIFVNRESVAAYKIAQ